MASEVASADFEVFGKVQGCNFTTEAKTVANQLGLSGWVKNTRTGTVLGRVQGLKPAVDQMIKWLSETGSPECTIEKCQITNQKAITRPDYPAFSIKF